MNLHRRQLTLSQKAMVAARVRDLYDRQAKERQQEAGKVHGRGKVPANLPEPITAGDARDQAGKAVGVSGMTLVALACTVKNLTPTPRAAGARRPARPAESLKSAPAA
jgi:hypothetical protein